VAAYGEILPLIVLQAVGPIARIPCAPGSGVGCEATEAVAATRPRLRVVGVRVDPCFPALAGATCRRQVRFVMQPFDAEFEDDALHVFYDLPKADFDALVLELESISHATAKDLPLGVHPLLAQQGTTGAFAVALRKALFARVGGARISRVTAMQMTINAGGWSFRGFDFDATGQATPIGILGTPELKQSASGFGAISAPIPIFAADSPFSLLWTNQIAAATPTDRQAAYDAALLIENPAKKSVEQESCVACHSALFERAAVEHSFGLSSAGNPNAFSAPFDLSLTAKPEVRESKNMLHAFGYRFHDAAISQRTVNESAAVAEYLNAQP
jgi:hypothetical protein